MSVKPPAKTGPTAPPADKIAPDVHAVEAAADPVAAATGLEDAPPVVAALKLRDLVARVVEASGGNKKGVKEIVEATLAQLAAALTKGEELNLPGLGKVRVARSADRDGRTMMTLKLRGPGTPKHKDALAEADEDV